MKANKEYRLSFTEQAKKIVSEMTLEEKVFLMSGNDNLVDVLIKKKEEHYNQFPYIAGGNERLGIPAIKFCDGPRGVDCGVGKSTCFPVSMCRGASFDPELEEKIGHAVGREVLAHGGNFYGGVCINLPYNPGWGRSQETYGEDSFALGEMGSALLRGVQDENVIACEKHFAFNSMENGRFRVNVKCDKRTEREVYLPHFKRCIDEGAACLMSSYNQYDGTFCGHHDYLLNQVVKDEWDFDGFIMSDFLIGIRDTVEAANGGMNVEMRDCKFFGEHLIKAVESGLVPEEKIDDAALRIVRTLLAFEQARKESGKTYDETILGCDEHRALALCAAREGITLIQNENHCLPFNKDKTKKIAVLGRLAESDNLGDYGSSRVFPKHVVTVTEGLKNILPDAELLIETGEDLEKAKQYAKDADAVIYVVGYDHDDEGEHLGGSDILEVAQGIFKTHPEILAPYASFISQGALSSAFFEKEGGDRLNGLGLHAEDIQLILETGKLNQNSAIVLIGGNAIVMDEWKEAVSAVLMGYYPGQEGGQAIAEILFGNVNPSGKLPFTVPHKEEDLPQVDWLADEVFYGYYNGYRYLDKKKIEPAVPFGFGLSYTNFEISDASFEKTEEGITASCKVRNIGDIAGSEVVQVYVGYSQSTIDRPVKTLQGFKKISLEPNEEQKVILFVPWENLRYYNEKENSWVLEEMAYEVFIGTSSDEKNLIKDEV